MRRDHSQQSGGEDAEDGHHESGHDRCNALVHHLADETPDRQANRQTQAKDHPQGHGRGIKQEAVDARLEWPIERLPLGIVRVLLRHMLDRFGHQAVGNLLAFQVGRGSRCGIQNDVVSVGRLKRSRSRRRFGDLRDRAAVRATKLSAHMFNASVHQGRTTRTKDLHQV